MSVINIVDSDNNLVASISGDDVILKNGYRVAGEKVVDTSANSNEEFVFVDPFKHEVKVMKDSAK